MQQMLEQKRLQNDLDQMELEQKNEADEKAQNMADKVK